MDKVRFGRALGFGARQAAQALVRATDAALTPDPRASARTGVAAGRAKQQPVTARQVGAQSAVLKRETGRLGRALWTPFARASGVLWLEVTGVFFGLFALPAAVEVARHRADFAATGPARQHVWFALGMCALFGWFAVSSFGRAHRRKRSAVGPRP